MKINDTTATRTADLQNDDRKIIKFFGTFSGATKQKILKTEMLWQKSPPYVLAIMGAIVVTVAKAIFKMNEIYIAYLFSVAMIILGICYKPKINDNIFLQDLTINGNRLECNYIDAQFVRSVDDVKKVIDGEEWYHIKFYFDARSPYFICQKSLLRQGTLQQFEQLFADKMVKKGERKK